MVLSAAKVTRAAGGLLVVAAAVVLLGQVEVTAAGLSRSCGSGWDVVSARTGWQQWWAADLADPAQHVGSLPVRTARCPAAENRRVVAAGALAAGATAIVAAGEVVTRRRALQTHVSAPPAARRFQRLGNVLTLVGAVLSVCGAAGLALLVANPSSTLFLYVSRTAVVLVGLLLLLPPLLLIAVGRATAVLGEHLAGADEDR